VEINLEWQAPIPLRDDDRIYACDEALIPEAPGIYVFARKHGKAESPYPLYIGRAENLRTRIGQQLNTVDLMVSIKKRETGQRILMVGKLLPKRGQQVKKLLRIVEEAYIANALTGGYDLLNKNGTKTPSHLIKSSGKKEYHRPFKRRMNMKAR